MFGKFVKERRKNVCLTATRFLLSMFQIFSVASQQPVTISVPSGWNAAQFTGLASAVIVSWICPDLPFQILMVQSQEDDTIAVPLLLAQQWLTCRL